MVEAVTFSQVLPPLRGAAGAPAAGLRVEDARPARARRPTSTAPPSAPIGNLHLPGGGKNMQAIQVAYPLYSTRYARTAQREDTPVAHA
jgi:hypothetical protein